MKIGFVRVFVSDFERALNFYSKTLGMEVDFSDGENWAQFESGEDVSLAIERCDLNLIEQGGKLVGRFVGVTLMVEDIEGIYDRLTKAGVKFSGKPEKQHWGGIMTHIHDPDGNVLSLLQED